MIAQGSYNLNVITRKTGEGNGRGARSKQGRICNCFTMEWRLRPCAKGFAKKRGFKDRFERRKRGQVFLEAVPSIRVSNYSDPKLNMLI